MSSDARQGVLVRTYVLFPDQRVRDHLTCLKSSDPQAVLDGEIDDFIRESMILRARHNREVCVPS